MEILPMQKLVEGIHQFQKEVFSSKQPLFEGLADGQHPLALFITCSDSRINPNLLTQTEPGELFILRNAGNIVPPYGAVEGGEAATIEYAVSVLGVKDIIICGHSHCGAMGGLLDQPLLEKLCCLFTNKCYSWKIPFCIFLPYIYHYGVFIQIYILKSKL